jgi:hypothetical protein
MAGVATSALWLWRPRVAMGNAAIHAVLALIAFEIVAYHWTSVAVVEGCLGVACDMR